MKVSWQILTTETPFCKTYPFPDVHTTTIYPNTAEPYDHGKDTEEFYNLTKDFKEGMKKDQAVVNEYDVKMINKVHFWDRIQIAFAFRCILFASGCVCVWVWVWTTEWQFSDKTPAKLPFVKFGKLGQMAVLSLNCHSAVQTQTQMQTEPEVFRNTLFVIWFIVNIVVLIDHTLIWYIYLCIRTISCVQCFTLNFIPVSGFITQGCYGTVWK